ncbi:MAG: NAD-dependent malic enzyme [Candidatus Portnoybacteria bacterium CG10_big_fil_rev_8_21_14_0_10_44_7]|uniref:NAD-dependent malic enzyme n=1 Tax=Candidatus Portnoybacteria bacterium CG10_big_fil_rev_8_21_14_0_10_44_7 TaxID=1974816 RepID=A0A2M8KJI5_9BACT|nr:MAG: NAD-dependent malic enzyme [Candidatus Portnoybacteria bacterium CG10_big_fil_rev_8_21_14_0_10_44_7]
MDYKKASLKLHQKHGGKMEIKSKVPLKTKNDLSVGYTPGVAAVCRLIHAKPETVYTHTIKKNTIAVVTDGSAVLGLGNIGPEAALPVMEGKAILFKEFGGVDAFPICLKTQDPDEIVQAVKWLEPFIGGVNLEDIAAPKCFVVEERLKKEMRVPVFHDDQHGTAIVVLAALLNALRVVKKNIGAVKIVINGAGAAALSVVRLLIMAGARSRQIILVDSKGIIYAGRDALNPYKQKIAKITNPQKIRGGLAEALVGADIFIGLSVADVLTRAMVKTMADQPIVFAMANPDPEIAYAKAKKTKIAIFGTGRSDYPNQINNVLAFPGIFRGALDTRATQITEEMKLAAAYAIAGLVAKRELKPTCIIPAATDKMVARAVAAAVKKAYNNKKA